MRLSEWNTPSEFDELVSPTRYSSPKVFLNIFSLISLRKKVKVAHHPDWIPILGGN